MIQMEAERVRREEEARLRKKVGASEAARRANEAAMVSNFVSQLFIQLNLVCFQKQFLKKYFFLTNDCSVFTCRCIRKKHEKH